MSDEKIKEMVSEHRREAFPKAAIVNSIHRNTEHAHVPSVVAARQTDGRKLHFDWQTYRTVDESWAKIYGREFGQHHEIEHLRKKEERREHRRGVARAALLRGEKPPPRPLRESHRRNQLLEQKRTAERESGIIHANERGTTLP